MATHNRSESARHRWDIVGDDDLSEQLLTQEDPTRHAAEGLTVDTDGVSTELVELLLWGAGEPWDPRRVSPHVREATGVFPSRKHIGRNPHMSLHQPAPGTWHTVVDSPLGELTLVRDTEGLRGVYFPHHWYRPDPSSFGPPRDVGFADTRDQLAEYLAGRRRAFDLELAVDGTALQRRVWDLIAGIPYGETTTYGDLATEIGEGVIAQQVGAAVGRNPLSIIVACHRVVGRNGKLTGYAGGLPRKRHLLDLEREQISHSERTPFQPALIPAL